MSDDFGQVPRDPFAATSPAAQPMPPMGPGGQQKSWFARNWWWFLALVLGLPFCLCCSCCGGFVWYSFNSASGSKVYTDSMQIVESDPRAQDLLGTPIDQGIFTDFDVEYVNGWEESNVTYGVTGPKGAGIVYAEGNGNQGNWQFTRLELTVGGQTIDLLAPETQGDAEGVQDAASEAAGDGG